MLKKYFSILLLVVTLSFIFLMCGSSINSENGDEEDNTDENVGTTGSSIGYIEGQFDLENLGDELYSEYNLILYLHPQYVWFIDENLAISEEESGDATMLVDACHTSSYSYCNDEELIQRCNDPEKAESDSDCQNLFSETSLLPDESEFILSEDTSLDEYLSASSHSYNIGTTTENYIEIYQPSYNEQGELLISHNVIDVVSSNSIIIDKMELPITEGICTFCYSFTITPYSRNIGEGRVFFTYCDGTYCYVKGIYK